MMPEEWPIAAVDAAGSSNAAPRRGRNRLSTVRADFFLDPSARLTEQERALMTAMLHCLVGDIGDELRAALPAGSAAANDDGRLNLVEALFSARLLDRPQLVRLLLRRADEERISTAAGARSGRREARVLQGLVSHQDGAVAAAAMALILARGRRRDRFGRMTVEFDDVPAEDAVALVHAVAAALRHALPDDTDEALGPAAQALIARHDEGRRLEAAVAALARVLDTQNRADDDLVRRLGEDGDSSLLVGLLARRAGIDQLDAWNFFTGGDAMLLARLAGCDRTSAAQMLAAFEPMSGAHSAERIIDLYDRLDDATVERCRHWMRLDPHYRTAREALERANG